MKHICRWGKWEELARFNYTENDAIFATNYSEPIREFTLLRRTCKKCYRAEHRGFVAWETGGKRSLVNQSTIKEIIKGINTAKERG